jgi:hypothetical protein
VVWQVLRVVDAGAGSSGADLVSARMDPHGHGRNCSSPVGSLDGCAPISRQNHNYRNHWQLLQRSEAKSSGDQEKVFTSPLRRPLPTPVGAGAALIGTVRASGAGGGTCRFVVIVVGTPGFNRELLPRDDDARSYYQRSVP